MKASGVTQRYVRLRMVSHPHSVPSPLAWDADVQDRANELNSAEFDAQHGQSTISSSGSGPHWTHTQFPFSSLDAW